eukprot:195334-Pelagomonas_calceolata.AAC.2
MVQEAMTNVFMICFVLQSSASTADKTLNAMVVKPGPALITHNLQSRIQKRAPRQGTQERARNDKPSSKNIKPT